MFFFLSLLIILIFLEGTVITLPLTLVCLLCLTIYKRGVVVFPIAFFAGLLLDLLRAHAVGYSSLFFVTFVFLILLYQRKYEINSYPFVAAASFFGGLGYLGIFRGGNVVTQAFINSIVAIILLLILRLSQKSKIKILHFEF